MGDQPTVSPAQPGEHQRLLEGWLPLAQEADERYGWGLTATALEGMILAAAPRLRGAQSALEARAILWFAYQRQQNDEHTND
ncbi:MAG: hypothetical protein HGA45_03680 [Chloroflexales bacterium]|nr:hypothetical protein [Chloroflexales bacterium]